MAQRTREVPISQIIKEKSYRKNSYDPKLTLNIQKLGLREPLVVEEIVSNQRYTLIHGYRRLESLQRLNTHIVECVVQPLTSETERLFKRLNQEMMHHRRTAYEKEQIIHDLVEQGFDAETIALKLCLSVVTIEKYIEIGAMDRSRLLEGQRQAVSAHGLVQLEKLKSKLSSQDVQHWLHAEYLRGAFPAAAIPHLNVAAKTPEFQILPADIQRNCLQAVLQARTEDHLRIRQTVYQLALPYVHDSQIQIYAKDEIRHRLAQIKRLLTPIIINDLTQREQDRIVHQCNDIIDLVSPPEHWSPFPPATNTLEHKPDDIQ